MSDLADILLHPSDEIDLRWYYCESEGRVGLSSNHCALVAMIERGLSSGVPDAHAQAIHRLEAAERQRRIRTILASLHAGHQQTLRAAYALDVDLRPFERQGVESLGILARVALSTKALVAWVRSPEPVILDVEKLCRLAKKRDPKAMLAIAEVRHEGTLLLVDAHASYTASSREFDSAKRGQMGSNGVAFEASSMEDVD